MTFPDLLTALRRFRVVAISVFLAIVALGMLASFLPKERFQSSATVLAAPAGEGGIGFGSAEATQVLAPPLIKRVESRDFADTIASRLGVDASTADLEFVADNEPGTALLTIDVTSPDPALPERAAAAAVAELQANPVSELITVSGINPPSATESVAAMRRVPILAGSLSLAAIAAVLVAVFLHLTRRRVPGAELVRQELGLQVLMEIESHRLMPNTPELFEHGWPPEVVEAFQRLRATLDILMAHNRVIAITSWDEGEGKTTITANLAWAFASLDRRVLTVDCDLRHPQLHRALEGSLSPGVADIARGFEPSAIRQRTKLPSLDLISAGECEGHPAAPLAKAVPKLLEEVEAEIVLIDTSPIVAAETTTLLTQVDAVIIVIDLRRRSPAELESMLGDLALAKVEVLGVVLNHSPHKTRSSSYLY